MKTIFKPRFEEPIDSAKQLIENNITLINIPSGQFWRQFLANSPIPEYQTLEKSLHTTTSALGYSRRIRDDVIGKGTHAIMLHDLPSIAKKSKLWWRDHKSPRKWWRGDLVLGNYPYGGYLSDKKWHLNEASDIFSFIFC